MFSHIPRRSWNGTCCCRVPISVALHWALVCATYLPDMEVCQRHIVRGNEELACSLAWQLRPGSVAR